MTSVSGVDFETAWRNRVESKVPELGVAAPIIGKAELIVNKRASARLKDLLDVKDLEAGRMR